MTSKMTSSVKNKTRNQTNTFFDNVPLMILNNNINDNHLVKKQVKLLKKAMKLQ